MACCSDLDLSTLHPPSADRSPQPLHSLMLWDADRLRRVSRWKTSPENPGKETLRCYARTILALQELEEAAGPMPTMPTNSAKHGIPNLKFTDTAATPPAPVALKSSIRVRRQADTSSPAVTTGRQIRWKPSVAWCKLPRAPPAEVVELFESWLGHARLFIGCLMMFLTWLPPVMLIMMLTLLLSDPVLALKITWRGVQSIPQSLQIMTKELLSEPLLVAPRTGHELLPSHVPLPALLPSESPPTLCAVTPDTSSSSSSLAVMLFAGEGGAVLSLWMAFRAGMLQIGGGAPPR